ncbi:glycosyl hydrolase [Tichowtungia aerotolerans]|uniref:Beta-mannosidase-like galactose-binding domain-containing protein n=1 Tax=Tichowtungia aerotolerans TaxID=2697043 RepID=A0A6P1M1Z4_9BACT|nr:glycosyl hydrolase [Tichowtungia aerotolerans]QHI68849.1 hypothetical protein GT409_05085 [Tichowtungia aerotolerans]
MLKKQFSSPPDAARPYVFWYWINGNISQEGLAADLDAMHEAGIGGAVIFNIGGHGPAGPVKLYTSEWRELMRFAMRRADELGLDISLNNSMAGWSSSGGPWITPELAMQEVVWSETKLPGGQVFDGQLPQPSTRLDCYRDIALVAFPTPECELAGFPEPSVLLGDVEIDAGALLDSDRSTWKSFDAEGGSPVCLQFSYDRPVPVRSVSMVPRELRDLPGGKLLFSNDGITWQEEFSFSRPERFAPLNRVFPVRVAPFWRIEFSGSVVLSEVHFSRGYCIADWTGKAMSDPYGTVKPGFTSPSLDASPDEIILREQIVDLTGQMDAEGRLRWDVPEGNWTVLRFGYTPTGSRVEPASREGGGLECDKFNPAALDVHWKNSIQPWIDDPEMNALFRFVHVDSYERHQQNWTACMPDEFLKRRGYDLSSYLPVLTGRVIGSVKESERFLWDFRNTVTGLMHDNYFGHMQQLCAVAGKQFTCEPYHQNQFNNVTAGGKADIPMCEVWDGPSPAGPYWMKLGASPAHVYGKQIVQCEAMTASGPNGGSWSNDFWAMKDDCDAIFCGGVNRMVLHVYVHQPWEDLVPGQTLAVYGTHFERSNTWWKQMPAFTRYLSRCQHLLQKGRFVADILYSCGENSPCKSIEPGGAMAPPRGYDYDVCDPYVILNRLSVDDGCLVLPEGIRYRLLVLPDDMEMTSEMVQRIGELVEDGAVVVAPRPVCSPSLSGQPSADEKIRAMADKIWGDCDGQQVKERRYGKGRICWGKPVSQILSELDISPDFQTSAGPLVRHIHKRIDGTDCYFIANSSDQSLATDAVFRTDGIPEIWDPLTGEIRSLPVFRKENGRTVVPLRFEPKQAFFVIFKGKAEFVSGERNFPALKTVQSLEGPWNVMFHFRGSPPKTVVFDSLEDWSKRSELELKYFSGTATYSKSFDFPNIGKIKSLWLDLGSVKNVAEVRLNGKALGTVWCAPWRVDIKDAVRAKDNRLEIDIVNLWVNRLIGDEQLPADCEYTDGVWHLLKKWPDWFSGKCPRTSGRTTFATFKHWNKDDPLLESGLFGPVTIQAAE